MPEIPRRDIDREMAKAEQMLSDARTAAGVDISTATVVNRLYYACFHSAQAALYARGHEPASHGELVALVGKELVIPGSLDRDHGRFLSDMATYRRRVDYGTGGVEREIPELIEETSAFLGAMSRIVGE